MSKKIQMDLPSADDLFTTQEQRDDLKREKVADIPIADLHPFKDHPFQVAINKELKDLAQSIREVGVLMPVIARPIVDGGYEIVSGHRRKVAAELLGWETLPVIVREMDDDTATVIMVDSNKQRENLLPSEKAFAYKMKLDALKRQGSRSDLTSCQVGTKFRTDSALSEYADDSARTIQRYIRLTNLIKPILDMVDDKRIAFNPAVELSYLPRKEQELLVDAISAMQSTPSLSQAIRLKNEAKDGTLTADKISEIMSEEKANQRERVTFKMERIKEYFPKGYTSDQMERKIIKLLEDERQRQRHRSSHERKR